MMGFLFLAALFCLWCTIQASRENRHRETAVLGFLTLSFAISVGVISVDTGPRWAKSAFEKGVVYHTANSVDVSLARPNTFVVVGIDTESREIRVGLSNKAGPQFFRVDGDDLVPMEKVTKNTIVYRPVEAPTAAK